MSGSVVFVRATRDDQHHFDLRNLYTAVNKRASTPVVEAIGVGTAPAPKKAKKRDVDVNGDAEDGSQERSSDDPYRVRPQRGKTFF